MAIYTRTPVDAGREALPKYSDADTGGGAAEGNTGKGIMRKGNNPAIKPRWVKGQSGNPAGRPPAIPGVNLLMEEVFTEDERREILISLKRQALKGNMRAIEVLLDRLYGKVKHQTEITGNLKIESITGIVILRDNEIYDNEN